MLKAKLETLKEFILSNNTYFAAGYANAVQDDETGIVYERMPIFPNDTLGNYFYLRVQRGAQFSYEGMYKMSDAVGSLGINAQIVLVACVKDADADKLAENLVMTMSRYHAEYIKLQQVIYQSELVVSQELALLSRENIQAALQRIDGDYTMVSLQFSYAAPVIVQPLKCITNPCKTC
jgi:hypothetical protein